MKGVCGPPPPLVGAGVLTLNGLSGMLTPPQDTMAVCFTGLRGV